MNGKAIAAALFVGAAACAGGQALLFRGDPAYEAELAGSLLSGRLPPATTFPLFRDESSGEGAGLLPPASDAAGFFLGVSTPTLAYDLPTGNRELSGPPSPRLPEVQAFLAGLPLPAELSCLLEAGERVELKLALELSYRRDFLAGQGWSPGWEGGDWFKALLGNGEFPRESWLAYSAPGLGVAAGRFPAGAGFGRFGSTILNPRAFYYDQLFLAARSKRLRFSWMLSSSASQLSAEEAEIQYRRQEADDPLLDPEPGASYWDELNDHDYAASREALKFFASHSLEWRILDNLAATLTENVVGGAKTPDLAYILPGASFHNIYAPGYANVSAGLSLAWLPARGFLISGEFLLDDAKSADESAVAKPASMAWQGAASYLLEPASGLLLDFGLEYSHVDRWTYVRWQPYLSFYQRQTLPGGHRSIDSCYGFDYGPDVDQGGLWARLRSKEGASVELSYELVRKGPIYLGMVEHRNNITNDSADIEPIPVYYDFDVYAGEGELDKILARPDELRHLFSLKAEWPLGPGLSAQGRASLGLYRNYGHEEGRNEELALLYLGLRWTPLSRGTR